MKKLGLVPADQPPTTESMIQYTKFFDEPLSSVHTEAIGALFTAKGIPEPVMAAEGQQ